MAPQLPNSFSLPREIIEEILGRLSVKNLLRLRCVSKSWRSTIDSRFFINKHLLRHSASPKSNWGVIFSYKVPGLKHCSLRSYVLDPDLDPLPIDDPANDHLTTGRVVGLCRGLFCILKENSFFVWNPATRRSVELPKVGLQVTKCGFGWEEDTDAYKVFAVVSVRDRRVGKVYSSKTRSWKTVEPGWLTMSNECGVFSCGKLHWLTRTSRQIESFDLKSEVFGKVEHPCKQEVGLHLSLRPKEGCLSMASNMNRTHLDVWAMKKYGEKESWVKEYSTPIPPEYRTSHLVSIFYRKGKGVTFLPKKNITGCDKVYYYAESLVSPDGTLEQDSSEWNDIVMLEQAREMGVARGRPKRQYKRKKRNLVVMNKKKVTKESNEIEQEGVHASVVGSRPKRERKMPTRYGFEGMEDGGEKKQVGVTEARPKHPNKRKRSEEIEQERVCNSFSDSRPKRLNRRRPARYDV